MLLDEICSLTDLTDKTLCCPRLAYLSNRYMHDLAQYESFCTTVELDTARLAIDDAENDLMRLLLALDPTFERGDAEVLNRMYLLEYMSGWQY